MSQFINIFCRSGAALGCDAVAAFVEDSWYGDGHVTVRLDSAGQADGDVLDLELPRVGRPVRIERDTDPRMVRDLVAETREEFGPHLSLSIDTHLTLVRQVVSVELCPQRFSGDTWELLDLVLAMVARRLDGLIVDDEAIYDQNLRRLSGT